MHTVLVFTNMANDDVMEFVGVLEFVEIGSFSKQTVPFTARNPLM